MLFENKRTEKALRDIRNHKKAMLTYSMLVASIINLEKAKSNLSQDQYREVERLYKEYRERTVEYYADAEEYLKMCKVILSDFDKVALLEDYWGEETFIYSTLLIDIRKEFNRKWPTVSIQDSPDVKIDPDFNMVEDLAGALESDYIIYSNLYNSRSILEDDKYLPELPCLSKDDISVIAKDIIVHVLASRNEMHSIFNFGISNGAYIGLAIGYMLIHKQAVSSHAIREKFLQKNIAAENVSNNVFKYVGTEIDSYSWGIITKKINWFTNTAIENIWQTADQSTENIKRRNEIAVGLAIKVGYNIWFHENHVIWGNRFDDDQEILSRRFPRKDERKPVSKYWRAEDGSIRCLNDQCPSDCSMDCPVYVQTMAIERLMKNEYHQAAQLLLEAVAIEPSFADAWNNLASCYGQMGEHQKAYDAYAKSYGLLKKPNPLYGMAVASKNLKDYSRAMKFANEFKSKYGSDNRINTLIAEISEKQLADQVSKGTVINNTAATNGPALPVKPIPSNTYNRNSVSDLQIEQQAKNPAVQAIMRKALMPVYGETMVKALDESKRLGAYKVFEQLEDAFPEAGVALGQYYFGTDEQKARKHFKVAADANIHEGEWGYAATIPHSYIPQKNNSDDAEWELYCLRAAEGGNPDAANEIGNICYRRDCLVEAGYWYAMAFFLEHPQGETSVNGIVQKWESAGKPEEYKAGTDNYTQKRHEAALCFLKAFSGVNTLNELMRLCLEGETLAGLAAGYLFEQANEDEMAYKAYNALVLEEQPHPHALRCCADMLVAGKGVQKDLESAFVLYEKAASEGNAVSMYVMGQKAMKDGDLKMAACWFAEAYSRGYELARESLAALAGQL